MQRGTKGFSLPVLGGIAAVASAAFAAQPLDLEVGQIAQLSPVVSDEGMTLQQYDDWQFELHGMLTGLLPQGTLDAEAIRIQLNDADFDTIGTVAATDEPSPLRIGVVKPVAPAVVLTDRDFNRTVKDTRGSAGGVVQQLADGTYVWARPVHSDAAGGLRVHLRGFNLPDGAELYFFGVDGEAFGPYTGLGPNGDGAFWTTSVLADTAVLLLRTPNLDGVSLTIDEVGHIGMDFVGGFQSNTAAAWPCGNPSCVVDANCVNGTPADVAEDAVAKMEWIAGPYIYTCSGGCIADNNPSQSNYFLTANHCLSKNNNAANVNFYWDFRTSGCNGTCPTNGGVPRTTGSTVTKTGRRGDFTLLHMNNNPPAGTVFLGWTNAPVANTNGALLYRISCPNFGPQVYSAHHVDTGAPTCQGWPRGERIYSRDDVGATDGGSSGSPVLNASSQIVGQLSGACGFDPGDPCNDVDNATVDGAFAFYYSLVQPFLNP